MRTGQVFVSHTSDMAQFPGDRPFVQAVLDAVGRTGMAPVDMRYFAARDGKPIDYCQQRVRECEIFVAVVGFRYGSLVPGELISYTDLEFRAATRANVPRLVFLLEETACLPGMADADRQQVEEFRRRLHEAGLIVRAFTSADSLELEVFHALSELPNERTVPQIWNVPHRNVDFTGRGAILEKLHDDLAGPGEAAVLAQALYGLGGVGKTQVALEYAHRYQADYDLIWWIPAEQPQEVSLKIAGLAERLGIKVGDNAAQAAKAAIERLRLYAVGRWLLIFDNAGDPEDLEPYLPGGSGHVVITSRNRGWAHRAKPLEVDVFTTDESVAHLLRHVPELDPAEATEVADALGHLPLAVEQASAWLEQTGMSARAYIEQLVTESTKILALNQPPDYPMPVVATWNLSFEQLKARSPAAVRLLQILAFCSPGPISMTLLYSDEMNESLLPYDETLSEKLMLGRVIRDISRFALIKVDQGTNSLQIHRLVQAVIRSQMTDQEQIEARHEVHKILVGARPRQGETDDPANWSTYDIIWPHLKPSEAEECNQDATRQLLIDWVRYQWMRGEFASALSLADRLQNLWTSRLGQDYYQTLHLQFLRGNVLRSQSRFNEAHDLDFSVLKKQRRLLGSRHPHALMTASGYAADLRALGYYRLALSSDKKTYKSLKKQFGLDHIRTLKAAHNLACSLRLSGDFLPAFRLDHETFERAELVLPPEHSLSLLIDTYRGLDMRITGSLKQSVDLLRSTYEKHKAVLGEELLETLLTANSLAASLRKLGELEEAIKLAKETHDYYLQRHGPTVLDALSCQLNLAAGHSALGKHNEALALVTDVKYAYESALGEDHPYTLVAANNLAIYYRSAGKLSAACSLAERTLMTLRDKLGDDHPFSLSCAINLANCLADSADLTQAETLERETIPRLQRKLGHQHPDTLACEANLAVTLHRAGHTKEAERARTWILDELSRILDPGHPDVMMLQEWRAIDRDLEPLPI
jgi:hypothetical protein